MIGFLFCHDEVRSPQGSSRTRVRVMMCFGGQAGRAADEFLRSARDRSLRHKSAHHSCPGENCEVIMSLGVTHFDGNGHGFVPS